MDDKAACGSQGCRIESQAHSTYHTIHSDIGFPPSKPFHRPRRFSLVSLNDDLLGRILLVALGKLDTKETALHRSPDPVLLQAEGDPERAREGAEATLGDQVQDILADAVTGGEGA